MDGNTKTYNIFDYSEYFALQNDSLESHRPLFNANSDGSSFPSETLLNPKYTSIDNGHVGIKRFFSIEQIDGIFVLLLLCFTLLVHIHRKGFGFFKGNLRLVFSSRATTNLFSESTISEFWYNFLLLFQTVFLCSIVFFIYFFESDVSDTYPDSPFATIISFVLLISLFIAFKSLFYRFIGFLFSIQNFITIWLRAYTIVVEMIGITAFIPVLLLIYFDYYHNILFIIFLFLLLASRLIIISRIVLFFLQKNVNFLYLIAYLCSVEIIPYILLYNGLLFLYKIDIISLLWH